MTSLKSVLKNLKKNNIYQLLIKNKLIKNKNLSIFHSRTRDNKNLKSFIDRVTNVIFLEKTKKEIYYINKKIKKNDEKYTKTYYGKFKTSSLNESQRRLNQFINFIKNKIVLDFGCGNGDFLYKSQYILKKGIGIDLGFAGKKHSDNKKLNFLKKINQINDLDFKFDSIFLKYKCFMGPFSKLEVWQSLQSIKG